MEPFVAAVEQLNGESCDDLRALFAAVAVRRPDLLEQSLFAERGRRTTQLEQVLVRTLAEIEKMERTGTLPDGIEPLAMDHLRLNHSTGRLHLGHSHKSALLFPKDSN